MNDRRRTHMSDLEYIEYRDQYLNTLHLQRMEEISEMIPMNVLSEEDLLKMAGEE